MRIQIKIIKNILQAITQNKKLKYEDVSKLCVIWWLTLE